MFQILSHIYRVALKNPFNILKGTAERDHENFSLSIALVYWRCTHCQRPKEIKESS